MKQEWKMPEWMEEYREILNGYTGGNSVEEIMNNHETNTDTNIVLSLVCVSVKSVVSFLETLHNRNMLG